MSEGASSERGAKDLRVFVYGILQPGEAAWPSLCEGRVVEATPARIRGRLYSFGRYPAVRTGGESWVYGSLLQLADPEALAAFDDLEGYEEGRAPEENEYNRIRVACEDRTGAALGEAWIYEMSEERIVALGGEPVPGGSWPREKSG